MVFLNTRLKQDTSGPSKSSSKILEKEVGLFSDGIMRRSQVISPTSVMARITSGVWDVLIHLCHAQQISECFMTNNEVNCWPRGTKMLLPKENYRNNRTLGSSFRLPLHGSKVLSLPSGAGGGFSLVFAHPQMNFLPSLFTKQYFTQAHGGLIAILKSKWL